MGRKKEFTDEQLIDIIKYIYRKNGKIPTNRIMANEDICPNKETYRKRFGSIKNTLRLAGINIDNADYLINKKTVSIDTALEMLKLQTSEKSKHSPFLLTIEDVNKNKDMPCASVYSTRMGGVKNAYKMIGIDYDEYNYNARKKQILNQYIELSKKLNKTPTSREIDKYCKLGELPSTNTCVIYFESVRKLQKSAKLEYTRRSYPVKTREELLIDLKNLSIELNRIPMAIDIDNCEYMMNYTTYRSCFGGLTNALLEIGYTRTQLKSKNIHVTPHGTICYSRLEYLFSRVLENNNIEYEKEVKYKDYISDLKNHYKFDFKINIDNKDVFIEIFGITGNKDYNDKTKVKIDLCKNNNLNLIEIYPDLLWGSTQDEVYNYILSKVRDFEEEKNNIFK